MLGWRGTRTGTKFSVSITTLFVFFWRPRIRATIETVLELFFAHSNLLLSRPSEGRRGLCIRVATFFLSEGGHLLRIWRDVLTRPSFEL